MLEARPSARADRDSTSTGPLYASEREGGVGCSPRRTAITGARVAIGGNRRGQIGLLSTDRNQLETCSNAARRVAACRYHIRT